MSRRKAVPPPIGMQHRCGAPLRLTGCACCGGPVWDCSVCVPTELRDRDGEPHRTVVPERDTAFDLRAGARAGERRVVAMVRASEAAKAATRGWR